MKNQDTDSQFLERWAAMYTLAASIPEDIRFDMHNWARENWSSECGTSACLAGHAALHPWFVDRGFTFNPKRVTNNFNGSRGFDLWGKSEFWGMLGMMNCPFDPEYCFDALKLVNGIDGHYETYRFTPLQAAEGVRKWMVTHWGEAATAAAISASDVKYSAEAVHRLAPWHQDGRK